MEFICFLWWQSKSLLMARPSMHLFSNKSWTMSKNQSKYLHNSAYYIISNNAQSMYLFREVCHTEFHRLPDVIKNIIFFLVCLLLLLVVFFFLFFFFLLIFCHLYVVIMIIIIIINIIVIIVFIMISIIDCFGIRRKLSIVGFLLFCSFF